MFTSLWAELQSDSDLSKACLRYIFARKKSLVYKSLVLYGQNFPTRPLRLSDIIYTLLYQRILCRKVYSIGQYSRPFRVAFIFLLDHSKYFPGHFKFVSRIFFYFILSLIPIICSLLFIVNAGTDQYLI